MLVLASGQGVAFSKQIELDALARTKLSADLLELVDQTAAAKGDRVPVIIQGANKRLLRSMVGDEPTTDSRDLSVIKSVSARLPRAEVLRMAASKRVRHISLDREVVSSVYGQNHLRATTGASQVIGATGVTPTSGQFSGYLAGLPSGMPSGAGVGIAILDSGVYEATGTHEDLRNLNDPTTSRVVARADFCSVDPNPNPGQPYDPYGHGTHVAATAAGNGRASLVNTGAGNQYGGVAFGADIIDVRVLSGTGTGLTSDVIAGIEWMIENRGTYNIRVANLSLGAPVRESINQDPLCQAVYYAIDGGITCVVAAGNYGRDSAGNTVYGGIMTPANLPQAITVGAAKTNGTNARSDDTVATYSSRGPSLVDGVVKPDLIAPGDHIVALASDHNEILAQHPEMLTYGTGTGAQHHDLYMQMSGTSVAAPVVAGTVALMLQANPNLTSSTIKSILQFSAQPLDASTDPWLDFITEGAGLLNAEGALRVTRSLVEVPTNESYGANIVANSTGLVGSQPNLSFSTTVGGESFQWGNRLIYADGLSFIRSSTGALEIIYSGGIMSGDGFMMSNGWMMSNRFMMSGNAFMMSNGWMMSNGFMMSNRFMMSGNAFMMSGNGFMMSESCVPTDVSSSERTWSASLLDQSQLPDDPTLSLALGALGEDAPGFPVEYLDRSSPLYPRPHGGS